MKTIVVTGGAGFIGSHLCEALLHSGNRVINIDSFNDYYDPRIKRRNVSETEAFISANNLDRNSYVPAEGDIRDLEFLKTVFSEHQPDVIVHLAAYAGVRPSIENPVLYTEVNVNGTLNLLEICRIYGIDKFVFASSSSVYGNNDKVPFAEDDVVDFPISPYAATKKAGELLCHTYHSLYGINMACLRFFTVYGPRQRPDLAIHKFTGLITAGQAVPFYGDGSTERDYTHIDDIIDGVTKAIAWVSEGSGKYEIFNLGESNTVSLNTMLTTIENTLNKKAILDKLPLQPGDVNRTFADISKAKRILGYNPQTDFAEGIRKFVEWLGGYYELPKENTSPKLY
ncbi:GDP-mannose 4,6-dehydratase [Phosphitispora fastidiosa]|uniref:GDP-mannose 4,6-dehydratase n=1 Tax=Phosphitispora fastidiosa TaxID=2837202 RepID=UPI001E5D4BD7|nr:GDP-mannose 4,6-dehydratase [Phosphitispora fastidiosa]MBU7007227.1 UDP-glucuronate 4-epimerase [Phosphitispora fastidiosa]